MTINRIAICLIGIFSLFAVYCSVVIGMSWDEPSHHIGGALRMDYLKSFGQFNKLKGGFLQYYPGLYDTISFVIADLLLKIFPGKLVGIHHLTNLTISFFALIGLFLFIYVMVNLFEGERGLISYYKNKQIKKQLIIKEKLLKAELISIENSISKQHPRDRVLNTERKLQEVTVLSQSSPKTNQ